MKELDKDKFQKMTRKARVKFGLTYFGWSNKMTVRARWDDKDVDLNKMTDEQVVLLWQLANSAVGVLAKEQMRRDLLPEELKKMYQQMNAQKKNATN